MTCTRPWLFKTEEGKIIELPCRRCMACRISMAREWAIRMENESWYHNESMFLTLTYSDENLPEDGSLDKIAVQKFLKRFRKRIYPKKVKYMYSGEYGDEELRPHYHFIIFGWQPDFNDLYFIGQRGKRKYFSSKVINELWPFGNNYVGVVESKSIAYVTRYVTKKLFGKKADEVYGTRVRPFMHASHGIGLQYAMDNKEKIEESGVVMFGKNVGTPRYYFRKLKLDPIDSEERAFQREKARRLRHYADLTDVQMHELVLSARKQKEKNLDAKENLK